MESGRRNKWPGRVASGADTRRSCGMEVVVVREVMLEARERRSPSLTYLWKERPTSHMFEVDTRDIAVQPVF